MVATGGPGLYAIGQSRFGVVYARVFSNFKTVLPDGFLRRGSGLDRASAHREHWPDLRFQMKPEYLELTE